MLTLQVQHLFLTQLPPAIYLGKFFKGSALTQGDILRASCAPNKLKKPGR